MFIFSIYLFYAMQFIIADLFLHARFGDDLQLLFILTFYFFIMLIILF